MTSTRVSPTTVFSGRYAGLQSASKRVRKIVSPDEESNASFGPAKKTAKRGGVFENV